MTPIVDKWGRPLECAICGARLRKLEGPGRPRKYCLSDVCHIKAQRERHKRARAARRRAQP